MVSIGDNKQHGLLLIIFVLILIFVIGVVNWSARADEKQQQPSENFALIVEKIYPQRLSWQREIIADGVIQPWHEARLSSQLSGLRVNRLLVDVGSVVKKGDILAEFETEINQAELQQLAASVTESQARYDEALRHFQRLKKLQSDHLVSEQEFKQAEVDMQASKSRLDASKAALDGGEIRVKQTKLIAQDDGVISERNIAPGSVVVAGEPLFKLIVDNRFEWQAELTVKQLDYITVGHQVEILLNHNIKADGIVRQISPKVSNNNMVTVYVTLNYRHPLFAGDFARGRFLMPAQQVLALPASSVIQRDGFAYVLKISPDNQIDEVKVNAVVAQQQVIILAGIESSDPIVLAGGEFLKNGDRVKVLNDRTQL